MRKYRKYLYFAPIVVLVVTIAIVSNVASEVGVIRAGANTVLESRYYSSNGLLISDLTQSDVDALHSANDPESVMLSTPLVYQIRNGILSKQAITSKEIKLTNEYFSTSFKYSYTVSDGKYIPLPVYGDSSSIFTPTALDNCYIVETSGTTYLLDISKRTLNELCVNREGYDIDKLIYDFYADATISEDHKSALVRSGNSQVSTNGILVAYFTNYKMALNVDDPGEYHIYNLVSASDIVLKGKYHECYGWGSDGNLYLLDRSNNLIRYNPISDEYAAITTIVDSTICIAKDTFLYVVNDQFSVVDLLTGNTMTTSVENRYFALSSASPSSSRVLMLGMPANATDLMSPSVYLYDCSDNTFSSLSLPSEYMVDYLSWINSDYVLLSIHIVGKSTNGSVIVNVHDFKR